MSCSIKRNHVSIWNWIQKISSKSKRISEFIIDETLIKVGSELVWLWVAIIEPAENKQILALSISKERNMFVAIERFISKLVITCGSHPIVSTDSDGTRYPQACRFLKLPHHLHNSFDMLVERTMQYIKDRTRESFDDYFPCRL